MTSKGWLSAAVLGMGFLQAAASDLPNIVLILADDMGWSDLGCYGGEVQTPNIDRLAAEGIRFTQAYNTSKCFPSRAALLTGLYAQQCGYAETFTRPLRHAMTLGEVLQAAGYKTYWSGKHHGVDNPEERGFDRYYGLRDGASNHFNPGERRVGEPEPAKKAGRPPRVWQMDGQTLTPYTPDDPAFYTTDAFTDKALEWLEKHPVHDQPFFLYLAYTAPHDPLMAWPADIARYAGRYDGGYAAIREARLERQVAMGLVDKATPIPEPSHRNWDQLSVAQRLEEARRMEVYAAMTDRLDQNVGRVLRRLEAMGIDDNTIILVASDNGASAEIVSVNESGTIGTMDRWASLGADWANVSNTPLRHFKNDSFEGGIRTPLIVNWPARIHNSAISEAPVHFVDIMATMVDLTAYSYPTHWRGEPLWPLAGVSLMPLVENPSLRPERVLYWEWASGWAVRDGKWKLVSKDGFPTLHDMERDPFETQDLRTDHPQRELSLTELFTAWQSLVAKGYPE